MNQLFGFFLALVVLIGGSAYVVLQPKIKVEPAAQMPAHTVTSTDEAVANTTAVVTAPKQKEQVTPSAPVAAVPKPELPATPVAIAPQPTSTLLSQIQFFITNDVWDFSSTSPFQNATTRIPPAADFISTDSIPEQSINIQTIALVRCIYTPKYKVDQVGGDLSPAVVTGTGVVVSPDGYILTAGHVLRIDEIVEEDKFRTWTRDHCDVALTDDKRTPISAAYSAQGIVAPFIKAGIAFEPTDKQFNPARIVDPYNPGRTISLGGGADLDFALLKIDKINLPYTPVIPKLLLAKPTDKFLGIGYPGLAIAAAQSLERVDTLFNGYVWSEGSSCVTKLVIEQCGIRYQTRRYKLDYAKLYDVPTELGKYTSYYRGGFSGGPLFYKGAVAGLMIYGKESDYSGLYDLSIVGRYNWVESISSFEIVTALKKAGITIQTVP